MSQMHYDEAGQERQRSPQDSYDPGYQAGYRDPFAGTAGQKLSMPYPQNSQLISAGQRLALAIVSVVMLVPLCGIIFGTAAGAGGGFALMGGLIGLGVICLTIMVINYVFNRH
ncbi:MAG TPA: hypothetical protein VKR83_02035 [Ktedonobacteraceae bacterium]|nr:hypothetical protein [Ktedonobacteraceae bacterium]